MLHLVVAALLFSAMPEAGSIQGVVRVEGSQEPISFATVSIAALGRTVQADVHGFFLIAKVPAGTWRVEASAIGYRNNTLTVITTDEGTLRLDFELQLKPVVLPGVVARTSPDEPTTELTQFEAGPLPMRVTPATVKLVPGIAEPDVLRALQTLPAVSAISDFSTALYVRGGAADQNLIELDGMPLFNPYHVGGVFSAISADAVSGVDVWTGALPARAGDRLSSAIVINTREGGKDRTRASGSIGLISSTLNLDGPINRGRGSYLFSARRTYVDAITDAGYALGLIDQTMPYGFTDAYFKATHRVGKAGTTSISGYWDGESVDTPDRMHESLGGYGAFDWGSRMVSVQHRQPIGSTLLIDLRAGYSDFKGDFTGTSISQDMRCDPNGCASVGPADTSVVIDALTFTRDIVAAAHLTWYSPVHKLRAGVQADFYAFEHDITAIDIDEDFIRPFQTKEPLNTLALYAEDEWQVLPTLSLRAGLRHLRAGDLGSAILPRLGVRWQVSPELQLTAAAGQYAQVMRSMKDDESVVSSFVAYDLLTVQPDSVGFMRGSDIVAGIHYRTTSTSLRADAFWKSTRGLVLPRYSDEPIQTAFLVVDSFRTARGESSGFELSGKHARGRMEFGAGYALLFARRIADDGSEFPPRYERRHQLDLTAQYQWRENGILSTRLVMASGQPFTPAIGLTQAMTYDPGYRVWVPGRTDFVLGEHNSARLPAYMRLDVAARREYQKRWFRRDMIVTPYLQILNVLNNKNALIAEARPYGRPRFNYWPQLPVLPTFGVEWRF